MSTKATLFDPEAVVTSLTIHFLYITLDFCPDVGPDPYRYWPRHSSTELLTFFTREDPILNDVDFLVAQLRWNLIEFDERNLPADREHKAGRLEGDIEGRGAGWEGYPSNC
ncbi:hypothetical protein QC764_0058600 [Podospora pseudoanserina]|uniref:Uncharacterized protein n=1 Tax=Podospora pseudoanserina TaxID=2609844 RepID=A0ABR0IEZ7_9PEZI|nr:hypothetical protein QC764_0058600 [Podospora pseudoanserina]